MKAPPWQITDEKVHAAVERIVHVSRPVSIVLFGSYVRGQAGPNSDLDILVVAEDSLESCRKESVRIRKALRGILMAMDIIVVRSRELEKLAEVPGLIYSRILKEGKVVHERAA